ncbi:MAG TPA: hypothetical protein V6C65_20980 [Allocoleopsis sp.]
MVTIEGKIQRLGISTPTWIITTRDGKSYEIFPGAPPGLLQAGMLVRVRGELRTDVPSVAMIGAVIEVKSFELVFP